MLSFRQKFKKAEYLTSSCTIICERNKNTCQNLYDQELPCTIAVFRRLLVCNHIVVSSLLIPHPKSCDLFSCYLYPISRNTKFRNNITRRNTCLDKPDHNLNDFVNISPAILLLFSSFTFQTIPI